MIRDRERRSYRKSEIRGCVDLGSSNFRLLVLDGVFPDSALEEAHALEIRAFREAKRYVGWGDDLAGSGSVSPEKADLAGRAIRDLAAAAEEWGCPRPLFVATNTLRESINARAVRSRLEGAAGVSIRVLSQREEAELGYIGASFFRARDESVLLIDAGGTSTEVSWGTGTSMAGCACLPLGTHRVRRLLDRGSRARRVSALLSGSIEESIAGGRAREGGVYHLPGFPRDPTILVTGGTAVSLAMLHRRMRESASGFEEMRAITREDLSFMARRLAGLYRAGRRRSLPLDPERVGLLPAGLALIEALVRSFGIEAFRVTARDLRWGIVLTGGASE
jgi:exopolyphosphatase / guanosine-5'-triphosphate,3'-diphosphate pyrophosphatase